MRCLETVERDIAAGASCEAGVVLEGDDAEVEHVCEDFGGGTDLSRWSAEEIEAVAHALNTRPRKTLGWKTPAEAFNEHLLLLEQAGVASTG